MVSATTTTSSAASGATTVTVGSDSHRSGSAGVTTVITLPVQSLESQVAGLNLTDLPDPPIGVTEIGPIPPPPMFSSPSPMLPARGVHVTHRPTHLLCPPTVASSSPNILSVVGHDLSDLQDDEDDALEESVDDSDSEQKVSLSKLIHLHQ